MAEANARYTTNPDCCPCSHYNSGPRAGAAPRATGGEAPAIILFSMPQ